MSLFAKHINASRGQSRVAVSLRSEEGVTDPLNGVVDDAPVDTEVDEGPKEGEHDDTFSAQRARLNRQHGMIRSRLRAEAEPEVEETTDEASAVEEEVAEIEDAVEVSVDDDGDVTIGEDEATEVPADDTIVLEDAPAEGEDTVEEVVEVADEVPSVEELVDDAPVTEETVTEEVAEETPAEEAEEETSSDETSTEEVELEVTSEETLDKPGGENIGDDVSEPDNASLPEVDGDKVVDISDSGDIDFVAEEEDLEEDEEIVEGVPAEDFSDDVFDEDEAEVEELETEMRMLSDSIVAIESFGINPTAMAIMQSTGLLDGTALESLGLESIGYEGPKDVESLMATEALSEKIKEKAARMSAKILSIAKGVGSKTMTVLEALWGKITGSVKALASASWEGAKAAGRTVKAHPYKTIAAVIVAIGAVAGILAFTGTSLPAIGAKPAAMQSFLKSLADKVNKIQWPFGKVGAKVEGMKLLPSYANTSKLDFIGVSQPAGKLGWTQTVVKAVGGQLNRVWTPLKAGAKTFGARAAKIASSTGKMIEGYTVGVSSSISKDVTKEAFRDSIARGIDKTTAKVGAAGVGTLIGATYFVGAVSVLTSIYKLVKWVVVGGFRLILKTFRTLGSLVGVGGKTAEATA